MKPKPFSALNHFTVPLAMPVSFKEMRTGSRTVRDPEVIALVRRALNSKNARERVTGERDFGTTTTGIDATRTGAVRLQDRPGRRGPAYRPTPEWSQSAGRPAAQRAAALLGNA